MDGGVIGEFDASNMGREAMGQLVVNIKIDPARLRRSAFGWFDWRLTVFRALMWAACFTLGCQWRFEDSA